MIFLPMVSRMVQSELICEDKQMIDNGHALLVIIKKKPEKIKNALCILN